MKKETQKRRVRARSNKRITVKKAIVSSKPVRKKSQKSSTRSKRKVLGTPVGLQSGDLQGLSGSAGADSESVSELLAEGNALEAGVVAGVENAEDTDGNEVQTHEVPGDDVPQEYLDEE